MKALAIQLNINKERIILIWVYNPPGRVIEQDLYLLIVTEPK
jgi:hypothetical protein